MRPTSYGEAEAALVGSVLTFGGEVIDRAEVEPEEFFDPRCRAVWATMRELHLGGKPAGDMTLIESALGPVKFERIGPAFLSDAVAKSAGADHAEHYAALIRTANLTRRVLAAVADIRNADLEGQELLSRAYEILSGIAKTVTDRTVTIGAAVKEALGEIVAIIDRKAAGESAVLGAPTGIPDLDEVLLGIQYGVVTVIAGRPSHGKSSLAAAICDEANAQGLGVHVFSIEDQRRAYALRMLSRHTNVSLERLRAGDVRGGGEMSAIMGGADRLCMRERWIIDDEAGLDGTQIALRVRKYKRENQTRVVVVDYAQLVNDREPNPVIRVGKIAHQMQALAREEDVALILVSQLNRDCEKRDDKRPLLADLRQAGELEQCAEAVMFVYRDEMYYPDSDDAGTAEILVRKNKNGRTGFARAAFQAECATFRPLSRREDRAPNGRGGGSNGSNGNGHANGNGRHYREPPPDRWGGDD